MARANKRTPGMGRIGRYRITVEGITLNVTTWPWQKKNLKTGIQQPVANMTVNGGRVTPIK